MDSNWENCAQQSQMCATNNHNNNSSFPLPRPHICLYSLASCLNINLLAGNSNSTFLKVAAKVMNLIQTFRINIWPVFLISTSSVYLCVCVYIWFSIASFLLFFLIIFAPVLKWNRSTKRAAACAVMVMAGFVVDWRIFCLLKSLLTAACNEICANWDRSIDENVDRMLNIGRASHHCGFARV